MKTQETLWDMSWTVLQGKFIILSVYIKKKKNRKSTNKWLNDITQKVGGKKTNPNSKPSQWQEIIKSEGKK